MRALGIIIVATALAGCSMLSGKHRAVAAKDTTPGVSQKIGPVTVTAGAPDATQAPSGSVISDANPSAPADRSADAAPGRRIKEGKRPPLPGGLGGDTEHRAYSSAPPTG